MRNDEWKIFQTFQITDLLWRICSRVISLLQLQGILKEVFGKSEVEPHERKSQPRGEASRNAPLHSAQCDGTGQVMMHAFTRAQHPSWAGEQGWGSECVVTCPGHVQRRIEGIRAEGGSGCGALGLPQQQATPTLSADCLHSQRQWLPCLWVFTGV